MHLQLSHIIVLACLGFAERFSGTYGSETLQHPLTGDTGNEKTSVLEALKKAEVIPDVLDRFDVKFIINPIYSEANKIVRLGDTLSPPEVEKSPDLIMIGLPDALQTSKHKTIYSLVLSDPDALSRDNPVKAQMCHWVITNMTLPGDVLSLQSISTSDLQDDIVELKSYLPPAPPPMTGLHRYVFALLASNKHDGSLPKAPKERPHWGYGEERAGIREWASENDLTVVAATFFYAQNKKQ